MTANIRISSVTVTPSTVTAGASILITAIIEPRLFGISNAAGQMIKRAAGEVISTYTEKG